MPIQILKHDGILFKGVDRATSIPTPGYNNGRGWLHVDAQGQPDRRSGDSVRPVPQSSHGRGYSKVRCTNVDNRYLICRLSTNSTGSGGGRAKEMKSTQQT